MKFTQDHIANATTREDLLRSAAENNIPISKALEKLDYESELMLLQSELVNLQQWIAKKKMRVAVLFEGRDASGKGGCIKRFKEHLNPRKARVVALTKPTNVERGQWYFRRYIKVLPNPGELVFFDRSWYNRAVVEPVMGFCEPQQYDKFIEQVPEFEHLLYEDNIKLIKFWFSISKEEQKKRFEEIKSNPLKRWKMTPTDERAQELWEEYTLYKKRMFEDTNSTRAPWKIIDADKKPKARLAAIMHILDVIPYQ